MSDPSGYPPPGQPIPYGQQPAVPLPPVNPPPSAYGQPAAAPDPYAQPVAAQQPYSGQPYSSQPYSGQPATGQPYPGTVQPPAKKSKTLLWVALGVVLVLLLCCGGVGTWLVVSNNTDDPLVDGSGEPSTTASASAKASPPAKASTVTLTLPNTLGGRKKSDDAAMKTLVETMKDSMQSSLPGSGTTVAAIYGDILDNDMLMVVGIEGSFPLQASVLDGLFKGFGSAGEITNPVDVPPGPLGGKARCADTKLSGINVAPCAWIDEGSIGMIFFFYKSASEVQSEFITLRAAIEKKS